MECIHLYMYLPYQVIWKWFFTALGPVFFSRCEYFPPPSHLVIIIIIIFAGRGLRGVNHCYLNQHPAVTLGFQCKEQRDAGSLLQAKFC